MLSHTFRSRAVLCRRFVRTGQFSHAAGRSADPYSRPCNEFLA